MTAETGEQPVVETDGLDAPPAPGRGHRLRHVVVSLPFLLLLAAVLLVALGVVFQVRHHSGPKGSVNSALVDAPATTQVTGQIQNSVNQIFTYDYTNPTPTEQAAQQDLTGNASEQYQLLFSQLRAKAPGQQLSLMASVSQVGVISLQGDSAQLLVFLNQTSTRASDKATTGPQPAQLQISAIFTGNRWKISGLQTL